MQRFPIIRLPVVATRDTRCQRSLQLSYFSLGHVLMDSQEQHLIEAMNRDRRDEAAKIQYELYLDRARPESVERVLLRREREIAASYLDPLILARLEDEYVAFRIEHDTYFWDHRGCLDHLFRLFKVWLVSFAERRIHAMSQALRHVCGIEGGVDHKQLPLVIRTGVGLIGARDVKDKVLDFVRRYKGPSGNEPDV